MAINNVQKLTNTGHKIVSAWDELNGDQYDKEITYLLQLLERASEVI